MSLITIRGVRVFVSRLRRLNRWTGSALVVGVLAACDTSTPAPTQQAPPPQGDKSNTPTAAFVEVSAQTGLRFQHYSGASGSWHMPEILGSGVALLDYDSDGDLDVFFVQSNDQFQTSNDRALFPRPASQPAGHRLFANQLVPTGTLVFEDVTDAVGLAQDSYGMGAAVGDYDNDGDPDLYVTNLGQNALFRNDGGRFTRLPNAGGAADARWSTSASFCDVNGDALLDLYVANYLYYSEEDPVVCRDPTGKQDYCGPRSFRSVPDALFINQGDGTFIDGSEDWGVNTAVFAGLGVSCRDFDQDGFTDVFVANDAMPNLLWRHTSAQRFEELGALSGVATNVNGMSEGSMGVAAGDFDQDGDDDVFITHLDSETNTLYRNDLQQGFLDVTRQANLAGPSLSHTGFGTEWFDLENDGDLDVFVANGAVQRFLDASGQVSQNYGQRNQLFLNDGSGRFVDRGDAAPEVMDERLTGRGAAFGDLDNDGDVDIVVTSKDAPARLMLNQWGQRQRWLGIQLTGRASSRDAYGAVLTLQTSGGALYRRVVRADGSYLSASDARVLFGLGDSDAPEQLRIVWPSGTEQNVTGLAVGQYHRIKEPQS